MATRRSQRIEAQIAREVSDVIERRLEDPAIGFVTVQQVSISPDFGQAVVFVTPLGDARRAEESMAALQRAAAYIRRELAARIRVYRIPRIRFQLDPDMVNVGAFAHRPAPPEAPADPGPSAAAQGSDGS